MSGLLGQAVNPWTLRQTAPRCLCSHWLASGRRLQAVARRWRPVYAVDASTEAAAEPATSNQQEAAPQSKAAARKARLTPPTVLSPPALPPVTDEQLLRAFSNGAVLIDKPLNWTSFDVCGKLRNTLKFLSVKKVGHAGTLDPMASGLLVVATGTGTKFIDDFVAMDKEYTGTLRLGEGTATYDAEAEVSERLPWEHITDDELRAAAATFVGDIQQVPPMYSAIKVQGQKLYEAAREGVTIERAARPVTVYAFDVWRGEGSDASSRQDVHFRVRCSKGTYVRSLAYDLGRALGSVAHLTALRRERIGELSVSDAWQFPALLDQLLAAREAMGLPPPAPRKPKPQWKDKGKGLPADGSRPSQRQVEKTPVSESVTQRSSDGSDSSESGSGAAVQSSMASPSTPAPAKA